MHFDPVFFQRRYYALVEDGWLHVQNEIKPRQPFLVIEGPSRLGKTMYAKNLVGEQYTLELNCTCCPEPDMREFNPLIHKLVLFDEATPQMVLRQKKLFQCPQNEVSLGASSTNCHAYSVWVHRCLFVICSNRWTRDLESLAEEDKEWLRANSFVLQVSEPMWVE